MSKATEYKLVDVRQRKAWRGALPRHSKPTETGNEVMDVSILTENRFKKVQEPLRELQVFQFRHLLCAWLFYLCSRRKQKPYSCILAFIPPHYLLNYIKRNTKSLTFVTSWKIEQWHSNGSKAWVGRTPLLQNWDCSYWTPGSSHTPQLGRAYSQCSIFQHQEPIQSHLHPTLRYVVWNQIQSNFYVVQNIQFQKWIQYYFFVCVLIFPFIFGKSSIYNVLCTTVV